MIPVWLWLVTLFFAGVCMALAAYSWWHASKWAKLIAYARIVVEYKGKVKIDAPLQEWALWCERSRTDKGQPKGLRGHVMYVMGGTRIAVLAGVKHSKVKPVKERPGQRGHQVRRGTWSATDETPQANKARPATADRDSGSSRTSQPTQ